MSGATYRGHTTFSMATSSSEKLSRLRGLFSREERLLILINADPDAIASAVALKRLLWRQVVATCIAHVNTIRRPDNLAMIRLLKLDLLPIQKTARDQFTRFAILDSQPCHKEAFKGINFDVIIDHHAPTGAKAPFVDIRPEYGATSTILTQYLRAAKIKPSVRLATALFYGIKTDTRNFERKVLIDDVNAFQFLFRYVNIHLVRRIERAEVTLQSLKYYRSALEEMQVDEQRIQVHLGPVKNPEICVSISEFFMRIQDIAWAVVSGICQGRLTIIVRNDGIRKDAGKLLYQSFAQMGNAGGHKALARAEIPLKNLEGVVQYRDNKALSRWIIRRLGKRKQKLNRKGITSKED